MAGWAVQGVGDPQRRVGCQACSRLPEGLLTQVVPALLATSLQSPVLPVGAGSPLGRDLAVLEASWDHGMSLGTGEHCWGSCC